nr:flavodoxin family protein [Candidatus Sigynarchaeum springense]
MVKKNVLIVLGSPRKNGNSTILANNCADGARQAGADVEVVTLQGLNIAPCNACDACRKKPGAGCTINDDMIPLYKKIEQADAIVLATPTYWFNMSAQLKTFIDRTYAMEKGGKYGFSGKTFGIIMTYADVDAFAAGAVNALRSFQDMCAFVGSRIAGIVHGSAEHPGDIKKDGAALKAAFDLGKKLAFP